jgi:type II secretion system protein E
MSKKTLIQIITDEKILSQAEMQKTMIAAEEEKISLETYLLTHNIVKDVDLAQLYARMLDLPYIAKIDDQLADPALLEKIPLKFLRDNNIIPLKQESTILITLADPTNFSALDTVTQLFGGKAKNAISTRRTIIDALNHFYPLESSKEMMDDLEQESDLTELSFESIDDKDITSGANDAPIIKLVNLILFQAHKMGASDIHIGPQEKEVRVRYRIDGVMHTMMTPPKRVQGALSSRIKIMADMNIAEKRQTQDGRIEIKIADKAIDIRVSVLPTKHGENIVMRILDKDKGFAPLDKMGFNEHDYKTVLDIIAKPNGIILVTGPTGSGKTTTLYSILNTLNTPTVNIITVEDPVEYQMAGIAQVQVHEKIGLTFAHALRSILRQDPDIVMIGETRDSETAQIAIQAALTGHLVLSTLHTNSAPASITRLIDMGIEPFLLSSSIEGIIAQRLVRRLCSICRAQYTPSEELLTTLGLAGKKSESRTFYKAVGCSECNLGYKGRLALFEIMRMSELISRLIMNRASTTDLNQQACKDGMITLFEDGIIKVEQGLTSIEEVLAVAANLDSKTE